MALATRHLDHLHRLSRRQPWLSLFLKFIDKLRIDSKEVVAEDERGSRLDLWNTQRLALEQLAEGLDRGQFMFYILKGRQEGISTITLAILLFWVAVHPRTIAALVCNNDEVRDAFRDTLKRYHESFPENFFGARFAKVRHNDKHYSFSNGSRIDYLVAGKSKVSWGESRGYSVCLCTEVADYGKEAGLRSFIEALAQANPDRLFLFESTAKGPNHWQAMWQDAEDESTICRIFLGWWAHELNHIRRSDARYAKYGTQPPDGEETELCNEVLTRFSHVVTREQLAWWRWKLATSDRQTAEQNQPWLPEQAFVLSGYSFFQTRLLQQRYEELQVIDLDAPSREGRNGFKAYRFIMGNSFWAMRLEQIMEESRRNEIELRIWEDPIREAQYVIGCDPAFGHSEDSDFHCIQVFRCYADKLVQVAEYSDRRYETKHCAWVLAGLAGAYRNCMVNLELFGPGRVVMNEFDNIRIQLRQDMYLPMNRDNQWDEDFMAGARWFLYRRVDNPGPGFVYNFECLALETKLPTPSGWTTMGDVREGDHLLSDTGFPTKVIGLSDVKINTKCYEITFDDGTIIVADEDHPWKVARLHWKNKNDKIRKTNQLEPGKFYIRKAAPLALPNRDLPLDPYLLGAWLGDGSSASAALFSGDQDVEEMVANVEACGQPTHRVRHRTCWRIALTDGSGKFLRSLRGLGVLGNKHIPQLYLRASHSQRLALLQGLMDTDGTAGGNGGPQCSFVTTSKAIADGFAELVRSLGFKSKFLTFDETYGGIRPACKMRYQFWFTAYPEMPVFRLKRKVGRLSQGGRKSQRPPCHRIVSIKQVESVPVKCVMVDSPTKMFLVGEGMIPTHNTTVRRKFELFNLFRDHFTSHILILNSIKLLEEMATMVQEKSDIAPQSPGRQKDDRPFAAALADYAWNEWIRMPLITAGATYDRISNAESGHPEGPRDMVDRLVYAYFQRADEEALAREDAGPWAQEDWKSARGLL